MFDESAYEGDDDLPVHGDRSNDYGDFDDPIYDDELDEDHHDKLNAPIWDVYGDDNDVRPQICDMCRDYDFDDKINFDKHVDYEEEGQIVNDKKKIDILDEAHLTDITLEGGVATNARQVEIEDFDLVSDEMDHSTCHCTANSKTDAVQPKTRLRRP